MSELKAFNCVESDIQEFCEPLLVYLKDDADKVIAELNRKNDDSRYNIALLRKEKSHQKYKRCLAMAKSCEYRFRNLEKMINTDYRTKKMRLSQRWWAIWLKLADKFKEAK